MLKFGKVKKDTEKNTSYKSSISGNSRWTVQAIENNSDEKGKDSNFRQNDKENAGMPSQKIEMQKHQKNHCITLSQLAIFITNESEEIIEEDINNLSQENENPKQKYAIPKFLIATLKRSLETLDWVLKSLHTAIEDSSECENLSPQYNYDLFNSNIEMKRVEIARSLKKLTEFATKSSCPIRE